MIKRILTFSKIESVVSFLIGNIFILILVYYKTFKPIFISMQQSPIAKTVIPNFDNTGILLMYLSYLLIPISLLLVGTLIGFGLTVIIKIKSILLKTSVKRKETNE